jgi:hypothetical protein
MDDFLHHLIVVAAFFTAALVVKLALFGPRARGLGRALAGPSSALQMTFGLVAAFAAHHRARQPRAAPSLARPGP